MRNLRLILALGFLFAVGYTAACYDPNLGDNPWSCSTDPAVPECPEGYDCQSNICVKSGAHDVPDAGADTGMSAYPNPIDCPDKDIEPNDEKTKATPLGYGHQIDLAICTSSDKDYYAMTLKKGTMVKIAVKFTPQNMSQGNLDAVFFGGLISESSPTKGVTIDGGKIIVAKADSMNATDTFYLKVISSADRGGPNFYALEIGPAK